MTSNNPNEPSAAQYHKQETDRLNETRGAKLRQIVEMNYQRKKDRAAAHLASIPRTGRASNEMKDRIQEAIVQEARTRRNIEAMQDKGEDE